MKKEAYGFGFVCLFGVFPPYSRIFHSYGDVTIAGEGLQILTCARQSWPLRSVSSLTFHICDTGHYFIMVIFDDLLPSFGSEAAITFFYDLFGTFTVPFVFGVKLYIEFFFVNAIWNKTTLSVLSIFTVNGSCVAHEKWKIQIFKSYLSRCTLQDLSLVDCHWLWCCCFVCSSCMNCLFHEHTH